MFVQCQSKVVDILSELAVPNNGVLAIIEIFISPMISATFDFTCAAHDANPDVKMGISFIGYFAEIIGHFDINMESFLDCHPNIVFRGTEPRYFMEEKVNRRILRGYL